MTNDYWKTVNHWNNRLGRNCECDYNIWYRFTNKLIELNYGYWEIDSYLRNKDKYRYEIIIHKNDLKKKYAFFEGHEDEVDSIEDITNEVDEELDD